MKNLYLRLESFIAGRIFLFVLYLVPAAVVGYLCPSNPWPCLMLGLLAVFIFLCVGTRGPMIISSHTTTITRRYREKGETKESMEKRP